MDASSQHAAGRASKAGRAGRAGRRPPLSDGAVDSVPDVVVEVLSRAQPDVGSDEVLTLGETLHSALLDGFALDLARAFSFSQRPPGSA